MYDESVLYEKLSTQEYAELNVAVGEAKVASYKNGEKDGFMNGTLIGVLLSAGVVWGCVTCVAAKEKFDNWRTKRKLHKYAEELKKES